MPTAAPARTRPRAAGDPRTRARRIARLLLPAATDAGGFTSTELLVCLPDGEGLVRPDCCVVLAEPPAHGVLTRAPELVVCLPADAGEDRRGEAPRRTAGPPDLSARQWLAAGARLVWTVHADHVEVHQLLCRPEPVYPSDRLTAGFLPTLVLRAGEVVAPIR